MLYYNVHGVSVGIKIENVFLRQAFYKRYEKYICPYENAPMLKIIELELLELLKYTKQFDYETPNANDNCIWLGGYDDIIIWIKNPSHIYFSLMTSKKSMPSYIWLTRFLNYVLFEYYGLLHIHCSCLTNNESCGTTSIFCGESGAGKSTIALSLITNGEKLIAEDNLYLKLSDNKLVALTHTSPIKMRIDSTRNSNIINYVSKYDDFFEKNVLTLNDNSFWNKQFSIPNKVFILNDQKSFDGSLKKISIEEGVLHFLREYSIYSIFNSEKLIDIILKLCSQCELYKLTPSRDVEKTIQLITQQEANL
ncbi:MAG: hypothetical protein E7589_06275 [Ruminococcaceae bacterium]|nr:hypothetical protein [Oscillospiraceae bacterium]